MLHRLIHHTLYPALHRSLRAARTMEMVDPRKMTRLGPCHYDYRFSARLIRACRASLNMGAFRTGGSACDDRITMGDYWRIASVQFAHGNASSLQPTVTTLLPGDSARCDATTMTAQCLNSMKHTLHKLGTQLICGLHQISCSTIS